MAPNQSSLLPLLLGSKATREKGFISAAQGPLCHGRDVEAATSHPQSETENNEYKLKLDSLSPSIGSRSPRPGNRLTQLR